MTIGRFKVDGCVIVTMILLLAPSACCIMSFILGFTPYVQALPK